MPRLTPAVCLALTLATATAASAAGHLVLIGGGGKPPEAMRTFVDLAGGPDALILVFPTASEVPDTGIRLKQSFEKDYGCRNVRVLEVRGREAALKPGLVEQVRQAGGIFFSGGDQRRITAALEGTELARAIAEAHERGAVIGGTSAGTACQSPLMITGDGDFTVIAADNVVLTPGLGLFPGVIVDQHFVARARHNRLISVVLEHPDLLGVGIDEATAVWARPDGTFRVLGDGWVVVYDASKASVTRRARDGKPPALGVQGMAISVLLAGDEYDLRSRAVVRPSRASAGGE